MQAAVVLLSGGLDSSTTLAMAQAEGFAIHALTIDYGQRHRLELEAACRIAQARQVREHCILKVDLRAIGGSSLTSNMEIPTETTSRLDIIPNTYVPARNTILLALALGFAEARGLFDLFIGVNAVDYSGYPDCRPEFIQAFAGLANLATKAGVEHTGTFRIHTPLISMTKSRIIQVGTELGLDYRLTLSCYTPDESGRACGRCASCTFRRAGFKDANIPDPTLYQS